MQILIVCILQVSSLLLERIQGRSQRPSTRGLKEKKIFSPLLCNNGHYGSLISEAKIQTLIPFVFRVLEVIYLFL